MARKLAKKAVVAPKVATPAVKASGLDVAAARVASATLSGNLPGVRGLIIGFSDDAIAIANVNFDLHRSAILAELRKP